jgi:hypothetical protein
MYFWQEGTQRENKLGTKERTLNQAPQIMRPHQQVVDDDTRFLKSYGPYCVQKHV